MQCVSFGYNFTNSFDTMTMNPSSSLGRAGTSSAGHKEGWFVGGGQVIPIKFGDSNDVMRVSGQG